MKIIFCNFTATGNEDAINYLRRNGEDFARLHLSFHHAKGKRKTILTKYHQGEEEWSKKMIALKPSSRLTIFILMPFIYLTHLMNILRLRFLLADRYDVYIGQNYFCAFGGIILKWLGLVKKSVYWVGDYFPIPPHGIYHYLSKIFLILDKFCLKHADEVWFMTPRLVVVRQKDGVLPPKTEKDSYKIVTTGIDAKNLTLVDIKEVDFKSAVSLGVLSKDQGIDKVIEITPRILEKIPDFKFKIIGSGAYEEDLKALVKKLNLEKQIIFYGFLEKETEVRQIIAKSGVAMSFYRPDKYGFTQFADSGKIKVYLSCGTPVVSTSVPYISEEVEGYRAGLVVDYDEEKLFEAVTRLLSDIEFNLNCRKNALELAKTYDTEKVMSEALKSI